MQRLDVELAIVTQTEHVQWLAGPRFTWFFSPCAALSADGRLTLVTPGPFADAAAADEVVPYEAKWLSTLRNDQRQASSQVLLRALAGQKAARRVGVEFSSCGPHLTAALTGKLVDIEPTLYRLRRRKDPDELARLKKAIAGTGAMYAGPARLSAPASTSWTCSASCRRRPSASLAK